MALTSVDVVSFGYLHGTPPPAGVILDLRLHFKDPHVDPSLRDLTADDLPVRRAVLTTPGIRELIAATALVADAYEAGPIEAPLTIAVGCAGGRHRAATVAMALANRLSKTGVPVRLTHRDLDKPDADRP
ncbi:RNase adapter RapZ [Kitasatospora sp. NPDC004723]|uniref:RapZ C-terminal domain-containing protein n=1 Tax=Kitasatospora sp. NPDC004723 TaxID=3154288 RepID=UPI0033AE3BC9